MEQAFVERAEEQLIESCMESKGFRYWPARVDSAEERQGGGYVQHDVAWARKYGYEREFDVQAERARRADRNTAYARALTQPELVRYNTALDGSPDDGLMSVDLPGGGTVRTTTGGCRATVADRLYGDFPAWFRAQKIARNLSAVYVPVLVQDTRFKRAVGAWARCMNKAGHPYDTPLAIRAALPRLTRDTGRAAARALEVELAVAEATCARSTPLFRTARSLDREYRREKLAPYRADITSYRRMNLTALAHAKAVMGPRSHRPARPLSSPEENHKKGTYP
ncbi:hypothetical protein [Streptomyces longispororuber]|nr:hypothetical protein [Streptomyces longispororuber]